MKSRVLLIAAVFALPALLSLLILRWAAQRDSAPAEAPDRSAAPEQGALARIDHWFGRALDPGPLANSHASLGGITRCLDCHGGASQVIDARCVACHEEIGERAKRALGWHGSFEQPCHTCHAEHRGVEAELIEFDRDSFQHDLSRFPLRGAHIGEKCEECHQLLPLENDGEKAFRFQGVPFAACNACHLDPHGGGTGARQSLGAIRQVALDSPRPEPAPRSSAHPIAGRDCDTCHRESGWRAAQLRRKGFDHGADTHYALRGAHASLACRSCHTEELRALEQAAREAPGQGADADCATCHDDPHRGEIRAADGCRSCHSEFGWQKGFDHARDTRFPLDDLHSRVDCGSCHSDQRFAAKGVECAACHSDAAELLAGRFADTRGEPDVHAEGVDCADCHRSTRAANRPAAMARRCAECHTPEYAQLLATWTGKLDESAARTEVDPALAERLRHSGVHNFPLARRLLASQPR